MEIKSEKKKRAIQKTRDFLNMLSLQYVEKDNGLFQVYQDAKVIMQYYVTTEKLHVARTNAWVVGFHIFENHCIELANSGQRKHIKQEKMQRMRKSINWDVSEDDLLYGNGVLISACRDLLDSAENIWTEGAQITIDKPENTKMGKRLHVTIDYMKECK